MISALIPRRMRGRFRGRAVRFALLAAMTLLMSDCQAQVERAYYQSGARQQAIAARNANFLQGGSDVWMNAYGERAVVPAQYCGEQCGPPGMGMGHGPYGPGDCGPYGAGDCGPYSGEGCEPCGDGGGCRTHGLCRNCLGRGCPCCNCCCCSGSGPYPLGGPFGQGMGMEPSLDAQGCPNYAHDHCGNSLDQCGPHYFDFSAEALYWQKERAGDPNVPFVSEGINGPIVISSDQADFDYEPGVRLIGRFDVGALSFLEFGYAGVVEWENVQQVSNPDGVFFTPFSDFGLDPIAGAGLGATEQASFARLELASELHNAEINIRRYWVGYSPRVTGTVLCGVRYTRLTEELGFDTIGTGSSQFDLSTENDLVGFQTGWDMWVCIRQGVRLGGIAKGGIYGNHAQSFNNIVSTGLPGGTLVESASDDTVAFIGEGGLSVVCDVCPSISVKAGYDVLFLNSVALAANNFDFNNAPFLGGDLPPTEIVESDSLYHGFHAGLECVW